MLFDGLGPCPDVRLRRWPPCEW